MKPTLRFCLSLAAALLAGSTATGQSFPLSENFWTNPDFVERFKGSYGVRSGVEPQISREEKEFFDALVPVIRQSESQAIQQLRDYLTPESSAALNYTLAGLLFQQGQSDAAIAQYETSIRKFPSFLRAYKNLGISYIREGEYDKAMPHLRKALELGGASGDLYGMLGGCYYNQGDFDLALESYRQAMVLDPDTFDWRVGRAQCLMNLGRYKEGISALDALLAENPGETKFLLLQVNGYLALGDLEEATANLELVRRMGEANASGLYQLGNLLMNQELPWLATQVYQEAINTDEGSIEPDYSLRAIDALIARGSLDDATALVGTVKSSQLDSFSDEQELELINLEAQIALRSGDEETGAQRLQEVVSRDPLNARARLFLGDYFRDQGNKVEAEKHYEIAAEVPEFEADALVRHAQLLVEYDEFRQAVRLLNRAQTIDRRANVARYLEQVERAARSVQ